LTRIVSVLKMRMDRDISSFQVTFMNIKCLEVF